MKTRRETLICLAGAAVIGKPEKSSLETADIQMESEKLAVIMQRCCGGRWRVSVDKKMEFVLVQKVLG